MGWCEGKGQYSWGHLEVTFSKNVHYKVTCFCTQHGRIGVEILLKMKILFIKPEDSDF